MAKEDTVKKATLVLVLASSVAFPAGARAEAELSWSLDASLNTMYVWRGAVLTDGAVLQPGVNFGASGLSLSIWANMDLDDVNGNSGEMNEVDYTVGYDFDAGQDGMVGVSLGVLRYEYPNTAFPGTTEVFAGASFDVPGSPSVTLYKDVDEVKGFYVSLGGSYAFGETEIEAGFALGIGDDKHNAATYGADGGVSDFALTVTYSVPGLPEGQSLGVSLAYAALVGDVADAVGTDTSNAILGVAYSLEF